MVLRNATAVTCGETSRAASRAVRIQLRFRGKLQCQTVQLEKLYMLFFFIRVQAKKGRSWKVNVG